MRVLSIVLLALTALVDLFGQAIDTTTAARLLDGEIVLQEAAETSEISGSFLLWLREHPYDLNTVTLEELASLPGMNESEAEAVIEFRRIHRKISSMDQLSIMENPDILHKIRPYVELIPAEPQGPRIRMRLRSGVPIVTRANDSLFAGSPVPSYCQISVAMGTMEVGGTLEKDAGERVRDGFSSGYLKILGPAALPLIVIGDYTLEGGQGLVLGKAFGGSLGSTWGVRKFSLGVSPYHSRDENRFLRGAALAPAFHGIGFDVRTIVFASRRQLHATIDETGTATSFYEGGLFRTEGELKKRGSLREDLWGGRVEILHGESQRIGFSGYHVRYSHPVKAFGLNADQAGAMGCDVAFSFGRASLFMEAARSGSPQIAYLGGGTIAFPEGGASFVLRRYPVDFLPLHAGAFSGQGEPRNEQGTSFSCEVRIVPTINVTWWIDHWKTLSASYLRPLPSRYRRIAAKFRFALSREVAMNLRLAENRGEQASGDRVSRKWSVAVVFKPAPGMQFFVDAGKGSVTTTPYAEPEVGFFVSQGIRIAWNRITIEGSLTFFDTDSYDARLSLYERDLPGLFTTAALYKRGSRWHTMVQAQPFAWVRFSAKYLFLLMEESIRQPYTTDRRLTIQADLRF